MNANEIASSFSYNYALFLKELLKRGFQLTRIGKTEVVLATDDQGQEELCFDIAPPSESYPAGWITNDKFYTKQYLFHKGFSVPEGKVFSSDEKKSAMNYAQSLGFPIVLKPTIGGHGNHVYTNISSIHELQSRIELLQEQVLGSFSFLVEKYVAGKEYRIFITKKNFIAAVHRSPASVVGDGKSTLYELIETENKIRTTPRRNCLCTIKLDEVLFDHLRKQDLSLDSIPSKNEEITLRLSSNVSMGGDCIGVTELVHPDFKKLAKDIIRAIPGLSVVGIDVICQDISQGLDSQTYYICELNSSPGLSLHTVPRIGKSMNAPGALANVFFDSTVQKQKKTKKQKERLLSYSNPLANQLSHKGFTVTQIPKTDINLYTNEQGVEDIFIDSFTSLIPHNLGLILGNRFFVSEILNFYNIPKPIGFSSQSEKLHNLLSQDKSSLHFPLIVRNQNAYQSPQIRFLIEDQQHLKQTLKQYSDSGEILFFQELISKNYHELTFIITSDGYFFSSRKGENTLQITPQSPTTQRLSFDEQAIDFFELGYYDFSLKILRLFPRAPWLCITLGVEDSSHSVKKNMPLVLDVSIDLSQFYEKILYNSQKRHALSVSEYIAEKLSQKSSLYV